MICPPPSKQTSPHFGFMECLAKYNVLVSVLGDVGGEVVNTPKRVPT